MFLSHILGVLSGQQQVPSSLAAAAVPSAAQLAPSVTPLASQETRSANDALAALFRQQASQASVQQPTNPSSLQQAVSSSHQAGAAVTGVVQSPAAALQPVGTGNAMAIDQKGKRTPDPSDRFARKIEEAKLDKASEKVEQKHKKFDRAVAIRRHKNLMEKRKGSRSAGPRSTLPQQQLPAGHFAFAPTSPPVPPTGTTFNQHLSALEKSGRAAARAADEEDKKLEASQSPAPAPVTNSTQGQSPSQQQLESDINNLERDLENDLSEFKNYTGDSNNV